MSETRQRDAAIVKFITSQPWGILPSALDTIANIVADHIAGLPVTVKANDKAKVLSSAKYPNIGIVNMVGTLSKRLYGLDAISGGETMRDMQSRIQAALDDPNINAIVLNIDSPGGTVDGTKEFADFIRSAHKPIVAYADGLMASAAYWIGSAADKVVAFDTSQVGSIGVIIAHHDFSGQLEQAGVKITHIYAGQYKALGNSAEPLSKESETYLQDKVDYFYSLFVDAVAENRGVDTQTVLKKMAEGKLFIGQQAKEAGLVDEIGGLDTALQLAAQLVEGGSDEMPKSLTEQLKETSKDDALVAFAEAFDVELTDDMVAAFAPKAPKVVIDPDIQAQLDELEQRALDAEEKLAAQEEADEAKAIHTHVISSLAPYKLDSNEKLVALGEELSADDFDVIIEVVNSMHNKYKTLQDELGVETPGAHGKENKTTNFSTFDEATEYVTTRDKLDYESAADVAAKEFPELYKQEFGEGD